MTQVVSNGPVDTQDGRSELIRAIEGATGIVIQAEKEYLLDHRLTGLLTERGIRTFRTAAHVLESGRDVEFVEQLVDRISTHETSFFRDPHIFRALTEKLIPEIEARPGFRADEPFRIWSAACSSGQEPYSIVMQIAMHRPDLLPRVQVLATDLARVTLARAQNGRYGLLEAGRGLDEGLLHRFFEADGTGYRVRREIRDRVSFEYHNLVTDRYPSGFHMVFCRNVAIYFSERVRRRVYANACRSVRPDGAVVLGSAETLNGFVEGYVLRRHGPAHYFEPQPSQISLFTKSHRHDAHRRSL